MLRRLRWRLRYHVLRLLRVNDGVVRANPRTYPVQPKYEQLILYYAGQPGDKDSDTVVAYEVR